MPFSVHMGPGDYVGSWADEGVDPAATQENAPISMEVMIAVNGRVYAVTVDVLLSTKANRTGSFK